MAIFSEISNPTPFGVYDNETGFQSDADNIHTFVKRKLGDDILSVELTKKQIFANFEEAPRQPSPAQNVRPVRPVNTERIEGQPGIERVPAEEYENGEDLVLFKDNEKKLEHVKKYGFSFGSSDRKPASIK